MTYPQSFVIVKLALEVNHFTQIDGSQSGRFGYFVSKDEIEGVKRVVQVDQRIELSDSQLEELADQAHIHPETFLEMISFIRTYLESKNNGSKKD